MKEGEEPSDFFITVDPKKLPLPEDVAKVIPSNYTFRTLGFEVAQGDVIKKDGVLLFVPAGSDKGFTLVKAEFEEKPAKDPLDELTRLFHEGASKFEVSGVIKAEKKDDKVLLSVAVAAAAKVEPKK